MVKTKENKKLARIKAGEIRRKEEAERRLIGTECEDDSENDDNNANEQNKQSNDEKYLNKLRTIATGIANPGRQIGRKTKGVNDKRDKIIDYFMTRKNQQQLVSLGIMQKLGANLMQKLLDNAFSTDDYREFAKLLLLNENDKKAVVFMTEHHRTSMTYFIDNSHAVCPEFLTDITHIMGRVERDTISQTPAKKK